MDPFGEGLHLAGSVVDLTRDILSRADRDRLVKTYETDLDNVQNAFARNDLDQQWAHAYQLLNTVGHPLTPGGSVGDTERQFRHHALVSIAELKYAKAVIARLISSKPQ